MKKTLLSLFLALSTFNLSVADNSCAPCNPCIPSCVIAGVFQTGAPGLYETITLQNGCKFIVTLESVTTTTSGTLSQYRVTFITPFCSTVATVASNLLGGVTVDSEDESGFVLGNIQAGDTVYFVSAPTVCN